MSSRPRSRPRLAIRFPSFVRQSLAPVCLTAVSLALAAAPASAQYARVSVGHDGSPADGASTSAFISGNGRFVAFTSAATNLVPGDTNGVADVFVRDLQANITTRVSVATGGAQATAASEVGGISDDGNIIVFETRAALVASDTHQCVTGENPPAPCSDIYVHNRATGETTPVSVTGESLLGNGDSVTPRISGDGRRIVFASRASSFLPDVNGVQDIFVYDRVTHAMTLASVGPDGEAAKEPSRAPAISRNGKVVAFLAPRNAFNGDPGGICGGLGGCSPAYVRNLETHSTRVLPWRMVSIVGRVGFNTQQVSLSADGKVLSVNTHNVWHTDPAPWDFWQTEIYDVDTGTPYYGPAAGPGTLSDDARSIVSKVVPTTKQPTTSGLLVTDRYTGFFSFLEMPDEIGLPTFDSSARYIAFTTANSALVAGDTNGVADVFIYDRDQDGDGMPTEWEKAWGFDPTSPADATEDSNGDGRGNLQEYGLGEHPRGKFTRYFAEGAANDFFSTVVSLLNPGGVAATVNLRMLGADGTIKTLKLDVPANGLQSAVLKWGQETPGSTFAISVESDQVIVADRLMVWKVNQFNWLRGYGSHLETATDAPRQTWHFAEGATGSFSMYYLLQNPSDAFATVTIDYLRPGGQPVITKPYEIRPNSRVTIDVAGEHPDLAQAEISATITSNTPIVAERALYRSAPGQLYAAGHAGAAIAEPSTSWFLAEGATGFFDEYVLIANPNGPASQIDVTYMPEGGTAFTERITVGGHSRFTLEPKTRPGLASVPLSIALRSVNDVPVVVERAMWWPAGAWYEASLSAGVTRPGTKWAIAHAAEGADTSTYVLIANVDPVNAAEVKVKFLGLAQPKELTVTVPKNGRYTVDINTLPEAVRPTGWFGIVVESLNGTPIVVERSLYQSTSERHWDNGGTSVATNLAPVP